MSRSELRTLLILVVVGLAVVVSVAVLQHEVASIHHSCRVAPCVP